VFWFSEKHGDATRDIFRRKATSIDWRPYNLVWVKSDNRGIIGDAKRDPRHVYETAMFGARGSRPLVRSAADAYVCPTERDLHPSTKPEAMLKHFLGMVVDETSSVFDPTCGSASSLRAAEALKAKRILGMDTDENIVGLARNGLRVARVKAAGSSGMGL